MAVITISRQTGSAGDEVSAQLASLLHFHLVKRSTLEKALYEYALVKTIRQLPLPEMLPPSVEGKGARIAHRQFLRAVLLNLAAKEHLVVMGYGGQIIFQSFKGAFHVRIVAPFDQRVGNLVASQRLTSEAASETIRHRDMERRNFIKEFFGEEIGKQHHYDLILNLHRLSVIRGADIIASAFQAAIPDPEETLSEFSTYLQRHHIEKIELVPDEHQEELPSKTVFAHPSEEEFASVLNFYRIKWEYEPKSFPIQWDEQGRPTESFTPDFYLPEFDTFIELTTMKQDLVTRKNRKVKRLRELYPALNLKIFYGRDYKSLLSKYGMD